MQLEPLDERRELGQDGFDQPGMSGRGKRQTATLDGLVSQPSLKAFDRLKSAPKRRRAKGR